MTLFFYYLDPARLLAMIFIEIAKVNNEPPDSCRDNVRNHWRCFVNTAHQVGGAVGLAIVSEMIAGISSPVTMINDAQLGWLSSLLSCC